MTTPSNEHRAVDGRLMSAALIVRHSPCTRPIRNLLNRINVFPVADGDTGTNLSLTLSAAVSVLQRDPDPRLGTLLMATADALLDGARGNSGAIMAQFFQGLSDSAGEHGSLYGKHVCAGGAYRQRLRARRRCRNRAKAQSCPSLLRLQTASNTSVCSRKRRRSPIYSPPRCSRNVSMKPSPKPPRQLDVLRKAGVVDAGAKGFVERMVKGMTDFIVDDRR